MPTIDHLPAAVSVNAGDELPLYQVDGITRKATVALLPTGGGGGGAFALVAHSNTFTFNGTDDFSAIDCSIGPVTVDLPAVSGQTAKRCTFKKIDDSVNPVTLTPNGGDSIDGASSFPLSSQWATVTLVARPDANTWYVAEVYLSP